MKRKILQTIIVALSFVAATISCKKDEPLSGIILDNKSVALSIGETATLTVTFIPANATNKKLSWESSDPSIATVDKGKVTGISIGEATITVTSQDGGRTATCIVYVIQPIEPEMVWVEGGTFTMGCTDEQGEDCTDREFPAHQVTVSGFYIGKYEITQKEWVATMGTNPSFPEVVGENNPVNAIKWGDAQEYVAKLNAASGKNYRLPTEAEWEFAARGGTQSQGYKYCGSNNIDEVAWYKENSLNMLHPVGQKKPNELGIYDMSGNLWEYCSDWCGNYTNVPQMNPIGQPTGTTRVVRGGSCYNDSVILRVSSRHCSAPSELIFGTFRLVLPAEQKKD